MAKANCCTQTLAFLTRNWILKWRKKNQTVVEILLPIIMVGILALMRLVINPKVLPVVPRYDSIKLDSLATNLSFAEFFVFPDIPESNFILSSALSALGLRPSHIRYFSSSEEAEQAYLGENESSFIVGMDFQKIASGQGREYSIRLPIDRVADTSQTLDFGPGCRESDGSGYCAANSYLHSCFVTLQNAIDSVIIKNLSGFSSLLPPDLSVMQYPKGEHSPSLVHLQAMLPLFLVFAYSFFINFLVVNLVAEKENQIKETMRMMGMRDSSFWISWILTYFVIIGVVSLVCAIIAHFSNLLGASNIFLIFLILILYGLTIIDFAFLITPFFNKSETAGFAAFSIAILFSFLYLAVSMTRQGYDEHGPVSRVPAGGQWALSLLSPVAMALAFDQALYLDVSKGGLNFSNLTIGQFPVYAALIMLVVDFVLYGLLAVYLDNVIPGKYGARRPPHYFLMPSYWVPRKRTQEEIELLILGSQENASGDYHIGRSADVEPITDVLKDKNVLRIFNIHKSFKSEKDKKVTINAVNGITFDIYEGQITALLGHNGAGKTTLINMLTGAFSPSSGTAFIGGFNVSNPSDLDEIRAMTGVCPQHNILFKELTCREHLKFICGLRGIKGSAVQSEVDATLHSVDLFPHADTLAGKLSGGQKRKLSLAMALIGDPKILFLDEPTAGMDPSTRRSVWTLLKERRPGHVILLTTHFMDEADILADRKAIMSKGQLRCVGSSLFLKNKYGVGYHLGLVVDDHSQADLITSLIQQYIPNAAVSRAHGHELVYTLPLADVPSFSDLFAAIESSISGDSPNIGILSYGVSMTTLEEVFLNIGEDGKEDSDHKASSRDDSTPGSNAVTPLDHKDGRRAELSSNGVARIPSVSISQEGLAKRQFWLFFKMRIIVPLRLKTLWVSRFIMPIVCIIIAVVLEHSIRKNQVPDKVSPTPLTMKPEMYVWKEGVPSSYHLPNITAQGAIQRNASDFIHALEVGLGLGVTSFPDDQDFLQMAPHTLGIDINHVTVSAGSLSASAVALYNDTYVHSLPVIINTISNALLWLVAPPTNISVTSAPWPDLSPSNASLKAQIISMISIILVAWAISDVASRFGNAIVKDRESKCKSQLRISGMKLMVYWSSIFCANVIFYLVPAVAALIILLASQPLWLMHGGAMLSFILLFFLFMPVGILVSYNMSFCFTSFQAAKSVLPIVFLSSGALFYIPMAGIDSIGNFSVSRPMHLSFTILNPLYCIYGGIYYISKVYVVKATQLKQNKVDIPFGDYFKPENNILPVLLMLIVHTVIQFCLLCILDVRSTSGGVADALGLRKKLPKKIVRKEIISSSEEDEDVTKERQRVEELLQTNKNQVLLVRNIHKEFEQDKSGLCSCRASTKKKVVVLDSTFAVDAGEILGLLGPNGAGKTTTLNMITAEVEPTFGQVCIAGCDIHSSLSKAFQALGYCSQENPHFSYTTLKEHLELYATVKGVLPADIPPLVEFFMKSLHLEEHAEKYSQNLSGGTQRKLTYAMSMLGNPNIVLFDEPSTGMDPKSKRFLWDTINSSFKGQQRGAILTTHYMEEADALCSRVAIMVNGKLQALGTTQHLKNKYGTGYVMEIKLGAGEGDEGRQTEGLEALVQELFTEVHLVERFGERSTYRVPQENVGSLSKVFSALESNRSKLCIEEYSFSQATLEQVFLELAKHQVEDKFEVNFEEQDEVFSSVGMRYSSPPQSPTRQVSA